MEDPSFYRSFLSKSGETGVDKQFRYRQKHVHDLPIGDSLIRLWDSEGAINHEMIISAFQPLMKTGFVWPYVALMPDYHPGEDSMIGSVIPARNVLFPSVIGGDLGCGMTALRLPIQAEAMTPFLLSIERRLRESIPVGTSHNSVVTDRVRGNAIWSHEASAPILVGRLRRKLLRQFASLGGGNHFLELQQDQEGQAWVMLHSGSRYLGVSLRDYYVAQGQAQSSIEKRLYAKVPYFLADTPLAKDYMADMRFVLDFARESRKEMMLRVLEALVDSIPTADRASWLFLIDSAYDFAHNYISEEEHFNEILFVHRKGAICLAKNQVGAIPGSMGSFSYVVAGCGNSFGFHSCSHGAGRAMSRGEAFRAISDKEFEKSMKGIVHEHDLRLKDERRRLTRIFVE